MHAEEVYEYTFNGARWMWQVAVLYELVERYNLTPEVAPEAALKASAYITETDTAVIDAADLSKPGMAISLWHPDIAGEFAVLVDGNHRAAKALKTGAEWQVYHMTEVQALPAFLRPGEVVAADRLSKASQLAGEGASFDEIMHQYVALNQSVHSQRVTV